MKKIIKFFIIFFFINESYAQVEFRDSMRKNVSEIENIMKDFLIDKSYLLYSSQKKMFLFIKIEDSFIELEYVNHNNKLILSKVSQNNHYMMRELFDKSNYVKGYIDSTTEFYYEKDYIVNDYSPTYFKINFEGKNYSEYVLAILVKPVPMKQDVYRYISFKIIGLDFDSW